MATQYNLEKSDTPVLLRMAAPERNKMWELIFSRYSDCEWGSFIHLGFRETPTGLVLTVQGIHEPEDGDLHEDSCIVEIDPKYIRRILRSAESSPYAVGFVHSHPESFGTQPSELDHDMENYISNLLKGYAPNRPFVSLIFSKEGNVVSGSGRVYWKNQLYNVTRFALEGIEVALYDYTLPSPLSEEALARVQRLASILSIDAAQSLARATVGVVGLSGTGSPVVELLARSGVGNIVLVDADVFSDSNLERVHGSEITDVGTELPKCLLAKRHIHLINPDCNVTVIQGRIPQIEVVDRLLWCEILLGCTDKQSARLALTEISLRFLVPVIDVGVAMEGENGRITGQVVQINRLYPGDPCVYCRGLIDHRIVTQELMSEEEKRRMQAEAEKVQENKEVGNAYWLNMPQLNTVGYLTTLAGSMATGFTIGYITNRFAMPSNRLELNFSPRATQIVEPMAKHKDGCTCQSFRGVADQNPMANMISAPDHWPTPVIYQ